MSEHAAQVHEMVEQFAAAWKSNHADEVASCFTEDGSLINPFGERADGRAAVEAMYGSYFGDGVLSGTTSSIEVTATREIAPDHAFLDATQTIAAPDGSVVMVFHLAATLRRSGDRWQFLDSRPYAYATPPA